MGGEGDLAKGRREVIKPGNIRRQRAVTKYGERKGQDEKNDNKRDEP